MSTMETLRLPKVPVDELLQLRWQQALTDNDGNRTHAAKELGVSVRTLQRWIRMAAAEARVTNVALSDLCVNVGNHSDV
jgi:ActR/RegA family two-component response regulator